MIHDDVFAEQLGTEGVFCKNMAHLEGSSTNTRESTCHKYRQDAVLFLLALRMKARQFQRFASNYSRNQYKSHVGMYIRRKT